MDEQVLSLSPLLLFLECLAILGSLHSIKKVSKELIKFSKSVEILIGFNLFNFRRTFLQYCIILPSMNIIYNFTYLIDPSRFVDKCIDFLHGNLLELCLLMPKVLVYKGLQDVWVLM